MLSRTAQLLKLTLLARLASSAAVNRVLTLAAGLAANAGMRCILILVLSGVARSACALSIYEFRSCGAKIARVARRARRRLELAHLARLASGDAVHSVLALGTGGATHAGVSTVLVLVTTGITTSANSFRVNKSRPCSTKFTCVRYGRTRFLKLSLLTRPAGLGRARSKLAGAARQARGTCQRVL